MIEIPTSIGMLSRLLAATLVALLALAASGCGGGDGAATVVAGEPIALEELSRSASASADAASGRFAFDVEIAFPGADEPMAFSGEGAFDTTSEQASFVVDMSAFAQLLGGLFAGLGGSGIDGAPDFDDPGAWRIEVVQDGQTSYVLFPAVADRLPQGKSWIRSDGKSVKVGGFELGELEGLAGSDPRQALEMLRALGGEVETVGVEELRGTETTHYRATIDAEKYASVATQEERKSLGPLSGQLGTGVGDVPVDVWLDADGFVRKLSLEIAGEGQGQAGSAAMSFELWDYGEDVEIDLPAADEVVDASVLRS